MFQTLVSVLMDDLRSDSLYQKATWHASYARSTPTWIDEEALRVSLFTNTEDIKGKSFSSYTICFCWYDHIYAWDVPIL